MHKTFSYVGIIMILGIVMGCSGNGNGITPSTGPAPDPRESHGSETSQSNHSLLACAMIKVDTRTGEYLSRA